MAKMGRPTTYTQALSEAICARLEAGEFIAQICEDEGMPDRVTVWRWTEKHEDFRNLYARARAKAVDVMLDAAYARVKEARSMAEAQCARNEFDAAKWLAGKRRPRDYGDKIAVEHSGEVHAKVIVLGEHGGSKDAGTNKASG